MCLENSIILFGLGGVFFEREGSWVNGIFSPTIAPFVVGYSVLLLLTAVLATAAAGSPYWLNATFGSNASLGLVSGMCFGVFVLTIFYCYSS